MHAGKVPGPESALHSDVVSCATIYLQDRIENSPAPYRGLRALRGRSAPGSVRESVSKNRGVPESVWGSALGALLKVT